MKDLQDVKATTEQVVEKVTDIIAEHTDVERSQVTREAVFYTDIPTDSLTMIEMLMSVEEELDISIPQEASDGMRTVGDVLDYVCSRVAEESRP